MYESLKTELEKDVVWKGADIDSALKRTKFNDEERAKCTLSKYTLYDEKQRHKRCITRQMDRLYEVKLKPSTFKLFLDEMYHIKYNRGYITVEDFMDCVCCPLIYDSKPILFNKLKAMLTNISEEPKYPMIKEHNIFSVQLIYSGMTISLKTPGVIPLCDAYMILNNIDNLYGHICLNCIYVVMSTAMYETTPLTEYKDILFNDNSFMYNRNLLGMDRIVFEKFLKTKDENYLTILEHMICNNTAWYKERYNQKMNYFYK